MYTYPGKIEEGSDGGGIGDLSSPDLFGKPGNRFSGGGKNSDAEGDIVTLFKIATFAAKWKKGKKCHFWITSRN